MSTIIPKLLIVDDLDSNRMAVRTVINVIDIDIHEAASGNEALRAVLNHEYFAILMDINMPDMDGFEATSLITKYLGKEAATPIIFLTAQLDKESIAQCYRVGGSDFLTKPIDSTVLLAKVKLFYDLYLRNQRIRELKDESNAMMNSAGEVIVGIDTNFTIKFANPIASDLFGHTQKSLIGKSLAQYLFDSSSNAAWEDSKIFSTFQQGKIYTTDKGFLYFDSSTSLSVAFTLSPIIKDNVTTGGVLVLRDITESKRVADQLTRLAQFDLLTGLYNRMMFTTLLEQNISSSSRTALNIAVHFIDLDNFKNVNDTRGHDTGDKVIKEAAYRIQRCLREGDTVARLGGDEFGVIQQLEENSDVGAAILAKRIIQSFESSFNIDDVEFFVGCSVGIAIYPKHANDYMDLQKAADTAMYKSKNSGRNQYHFFTEELQVAITHHMRLVTALKQALENNEISVVYQPQIDIKSQCVSGIEALIRWTNPSLGEISPVEFIPIAEHTGIIGELGHWVLETACKRMQHWQSGLQTQALNLHVAVNISVKQMIQGDLAETVKKIMTKTHLPPQSLKLEITESVLMEDPQSVARELHRIHAMGIELAIDDFGTGFSSLSYLGILPLRWMKVDRCFVSDICNNPINQKIVLSIVRLAESLGYEVIAEGVETEDELNYLAELGCRYIQGYYFSKPLNEDQVEAFICDFANKPPVAFNHRLHSIQDSHNIRPGR